MSVKTRAFKMLKGLLILLACLSWPLVFVGALVWTGSMSATCEVLDHCADRIMN